MMFSVDDISKKISEHCEFSECLKTKDFALLSQQVKEAFEIVYDFHKRGAGGRVVCQANSFVCDLLLQAICKTLPSLVKVHQKYLKNFCVVALGGYGRSEMSPNSDIDIMFLYSGRVSKNVKEEIADAFLYPLWNLGMKVGHVSLTRSEAIANANNDAVFAIALLDMRFLFGTKSVFANFKLRSDMAMLLNRRTRFAQIIRLAFERRKKFASAYVQEPNLKSGIGSLRDCQTLAWIAKLYFGDSVRELAKRKIITLSEYLDFLRKCDFLMRVRNQLHYIATSPTETVDAEYQPLLAEFFCPQIQDERQRTEFFMRKLYFAFRSIDFLLRTCRSRMRLPLPRDIKQAMYPTNPDTLDNKKFRFNGFYIKNAEMFASNSNVFKRSPLRIVEVFEKCQQFGVLPSESLQLLIRDNLSVASKIKDEPQTISTFLRVITNSGKVFDTLKTMHFWGLLGVVFPEFAEVTCMVQHEYYHQYTADYHTLKAIEKLDKIFCACSDDGIYWRYHKALMSLGSPELIYVMILLHDIGKAEANKSHTQVSAEIAERVLKRWNLPQSDIDDIVFAVKNHLEMARFWQRNDVDDQDAIANFAELVGNETNLKHLYILTFCDANATNDSFWNSYKQSLHETLYTNTLQYLSGADNFTEKSQKNIVKEILNSGEVQGLENLLTEHVENTPQEYFRNHNRADIIRHIRLIDSFKKTLQQGKDIPSINWDDHPRRSISSLCVVSSDRSGLFLTLVGALTLTGFDILGSKIITRKDGITIDTFFLSSSGDGVLKNKNLRESFKSILLRAMMGKLSLDSEVEKILERTSKKAKGDLIRSEKVFKRSKNIVFEAKAFDCRGVLYKIAKSIKDRGYDITFARVNTEHSLGRNTFYITRHED